MLAFWQTIRCHDLPGGDTARFHVLLFGWFPKLAVVAAHSRSGDCPGRRR